MNFIKPIPTELVPFLGVASETAGTMLVRVKYQCLEAMAVCDLYLTSKEDKCIELLRDEVRCALEDDRFGYLQTENEDGYRDMNSFTSRHGLYGSAHVPFALENNPGTSHKACAVKLETVRKQYTLVFFSDTYIIQK